MNRKNAKNKAAADDGSMSVSGHLRELRNRILICLAAILAGFALCLAFAPGILTMMMDMGNDYGYRFVYIAPQELLMVQLSVALIGSLVVAFPLIAYHVYGFCSPGLRTKEKTVIILTMLAGTVFFLKQHMAGFSGNQSDISYEDFHPSVLYCSRVRDARLTYYHSHSILEIAYILSGKGQYLIDGVTYDVTSIRSLPQCFVRTAVRA